MEMQRFQQASIATQNNLHTIAQSSEIRALSHLSLPEIEAAVDVVANITPAGNVPGLILSGLARLPGRKPPLKTIHRDIDLLFRGVSQALDQAIYGAFFAGPAAVIWGYQNLLKLAGKDPDDSFPEGIWQFYVDYALREDTARHTNETQGFDIILKQHGVQLTQVDRLAAWAMAAIYTLHQYKVLLENEWRERVYTALIRDVTAHQPDAKQFEDLYSQWEKQRPYTRGQDATTVEDYPRYRRVKFDRFLAKLTTDLEPMVLERWRQAIRAAEASDLLSYQQQMSILAYLNPGQYGEERTPVNLTDTHIGIVYGGHYYLIPSCQPHIETPADVHLVRRQIAAILEYPAEHAPAMLTTLAQVERSSIPGLKQKLTPGLVEELNELRCVPIFLNFDQRPADLPLGEIRQAERGMGDHALTIFDTGKTFVFDQSHIFFDGAWGAALAEIMTNEALSWAVYLNGLPPAQPYRIRPYSPILQLQPNDHKLIKAAPRVMAEADVESSQINVKSILSLRKQFKQRSDLLRLTVNDLLILYRAIHAATYELDPALFRELREINPNHPALEIATQQYNPSILIPVDASQRSPRDRLYPMNFEVPLAELDLIRLHRRVITALDLYESTPGDRSAAYAEFDSLQRTYLATLAGFGEVMSRAKEIANAGESASIGTIKLLAHMPTPLQRLLDQVPNRFELLNDIIKGREVFSNVGAVAKTSTLTRFISAKDDNHKKNLVWGVLTDANGVMQISLRDFRPCIGILIEQGRADLARRIAHDYLMSYVEGLNIYVSDLRRITMTSRETRLQKGDMDIHG